jgi:signal transduction histidine kinase/PAS domain-containing protein
MHKVRVDTGAELSDLRPLLRELVALSAVPAVWVERAATVRESGTEAVATGVADALCGLMQLDFAFVRLRDPVSDRAVDVTRGDAWKSFPEWLESHLPATGRLPRRAHVPDVGGGSEPCRGFVVPIGLGGEAGVLAAARERSEFPAATDELLISLAANQAATAFQSARLIHERRRAEEELREARNQLEVRVVERTAELRRSEAYLAEAQRLTRTGSFAIDVSTREVTHSSGEHTRLYGFDPEEGTPSLSEFLERIHPHDRARCTEAFERGIREATKIEVEYRVVPPQSPARQHHAIADPVFDAAGEVAEVVGTIVDVTEPRHAETELARLADEQAALRRVATLVAREAPQAEVFTAIAEEIGQLLGTEQIRMLRYEGDRSAVVVGSSGNDDVFPHGSRQLLDGDTAASRVLRTGRTARIDDYGTASGPLAETARSIGVRSAVGAPILVEGRLWGAIVTATTREEPPPPETESRLGQFTELMATAIANTEARAEVERLAEEQAALRRVATLVAKESPPAEVFAKVAEELANVLGDVDCSLFRDEGDGTASAVALWGAGVSAGLPVGTRLPVDGDGVIASVLREGRPCRIGDYSGATGAIAERGRELGIRSAVGCPIVVGGRIWGAMGAARYEAEALPPVTETRMVQFAELVATAIANAEARNEVMRLAEEQAALRRVATLVAQGAAPTAVFDAVAAEMERLLGADGVTLSRYELAEEVTVVAHRGANAARVPPGTRVRHGGENVTSIVRRTKRPARLGHYEGTEGPIAELVRDLGVRASVGAPIIVDGQLWGCTIAAWQGELSPPADTEERMTKFAALLDTAIANADSRDQLAASRARLVTAGDEARRRVVRDLHDGAQQRLVHAIVSLKLAQRAFGEGDGKAEALVGEALEHAEQGNAELRELAHGILPAVLASGGLRAGVEAFVGRLDLPVRVEIPAARLPAEVEASAYFIVAEALTNVVKHSHAERAEVTASVEDGTLRVQVRDHGIGGADADGPGLVGIGDRATALGGRLDVESPPGAGTLVTATLPLSSG